MKKLFKRLGITVLIIVVILFILIIAMIANLTAKAKNDMKTLNYSGVDVSEVADGIYIGNADTAVVKAEVEVEVKDHSIIRIDILKHDNGLGSKAEVIVEDMKEQNTYEVDSISGATLSSEVIKSAVSDALSKGKE